MKKMIAITSLLVSLFASPVVLAEMVNINTADVATLDSLDGIGEKKAEAIVAYRTEHGEFKTLEDLKEVSGIGDKLFDNIKDNISLADADTAEADKSAKTTDTAETEAVAEKTEVKAEKASAKDEKAEAADKVSEKSTVKADKT
ncbi:MAG: helix-hairpin-helix domain-containing protein [Candidatus Thiothrix putei]|uniref:Helix-hairpin-helix motif-containing protein n=2 Tax=Thiothrix TaxID=1030 RepID=A0A1H3YQY9_9GAMM|nr:helix-hairpin-helix domain-containing protein [Thiothrix caldifontis]WGZ92879.1 MAG: helix-hairpin-helix domain-containing protein [Candidatus Thiothrix putei]SEA13900.1 Helix-hairpin-helix motif-containing protein [Thiothrix caldifontis]